MRSVFQAFASQAAVSPNAVAVKHYCNDAYGETSYGQLLDMAQRYCYIIGPCIKELGGDMTIFIHVMISPSLELVALILAIWSVNGIYVPYTRGNLRRSKLLLSRVQSEPRLPLDVSKFICPLLNLAYLVHTSGTTGSANAVLVPHSTLLTNLDELQESYFADTDGRSPEAFTTILLSPPTFDPSLVEMFLPLITGRAVTIPPTLQSFLSDPLPLLRVCAVTHLSCTPSLLLALPHEAVRDILLGRTSVTDLSLGGEPYPLRALQKTSEKIYIRCWNLYGTTECSVWACIARVDVDQASSGTGDDRLQLGSTVPDEKERSNEESASSSNSTMRPRKRRRVHAAAVEDNLVPLGQPLSHTWLLLVDPSSNDVLWSNSPQFPHKQLPTMSECVAEVYLGGADKVTFVWPLDDPGPPPPVVRPTKDLVSVRFTDSNSCPTIYFLERCDDQVKRLGKRIRLGEIAAAVEASFTHAGGMCQAMMVQPTQNEFSSHPGVLVAFLSASSPVNHIPTIPALMELSEAISLLELNSTSLDVLPEHGRPDFVVLLGSLWPITENSKLDKRNLKNIFWNLYTVRQDRIEKESEIVPEQDLFRYLSELVLSLVRARLPNRPSLPMTIDMYFLAEGGSSFDGAQIATVLAHEVAKRRGPMHNDPGLLFKTILNGTLKDVVDLTINMMTQGTSETMRSNKYTPTPERSDAKTLVEASPDVILTRNSVLDLSHDITDRIIGALERHILDHHPHSESSTRVLWQVPLNKCVDSSPVVAIYLDKSGIENVRGVVFAASHSGIVAAADLVTGEVLWTSQLARCEADVLLTKDGKSVIVGCYDGCIYFISSSTGKVEWSYNTGGEIKGAAVEDTDGGIWVGSRSGKIIRIGDGRTVDFINIAPIFGSPTVYESMRSAAHTTYSVFVGTLLGDVLHVVATLDTPAGSTSMEIRWRTNLGKPVFSSVIGLKERRMVFAGCVDGGMYALDWATGERIWTHRSTHPIFSTPVYFRLPNELDSDRIVFGTHSGSLMCLDVTSGSVKWTHISKPAMPIFASPSAVVDGTTVSVIAVETNGRMFIVDAHTGSEMVAINVPGDAFASPVIVGRRLAVGASRDDVVRLIDFGSGTAHGPGQLSLMSGHARKASQLDAALRIASGSTSTVPSPRFLPSSAPAADPLISLSAAPSLKLQPEAQDSTLDFIRTPNLDMSEVDEETPQEPEGPDDEVENGEEQQLENDNIQQRQEEYGHMLGMPKWKGSLVKKHRSIEDRAKADIHVNPFLTSKPLVPFWLDPGNILYSILFGWWLALSFLIVTAILGFLGLIGTLGRSTLGAFGVLSGMWWDFERCYCYSEVLLSLARYVFFPFGLVVERLRDLPQSTRLHGERESRIESEHGNTFDDYFGRSPLLSRVPSDQLESGERQPLLSRREQQSSELPDEGEDFIDDEEPFTPTAARPYKGLFPSSETSDQVHVESSYGGPPHLRPRSTPPPQHLQALPSPPQYSSSYNPSGMNSASSTRRASIATGAGTIPRPLQSPAVPFIHLHPGAFPGAAASFPGAGALAQAGFTRRSKNLESPRDPYSTSVPIRAVLHPQHYDSFASSMSPQPSSGAHDTGLMSDETSDELLSSPPRRKRASLWRHALYLPEHGPRKFMLADGGSSPDDEASVDFTQAPVPHTSVRRIDDVQVSVASFAAAMAGIPTSPQASPYISKPSLLRLNSYRPVTRSYSNMEAEILLCIYHAVGWLYYKTVLDGVNIIIVNMFLLVPITLVLGLFTPLQKTPEGALVLFATSLAAVVPCAYLIGQAIASIAAQAKSMAMGAVLNATFGSIVEILYVRVVCAYNGKLPLVEGGLIGSFLFGMLLLPGLSMAFGGLKTHEQKFNSITITLLWVGVIGAFTPTIFHRVFAKFDVVCQEPAKLTGCHIVQPHPLTDPLYMQGTRPLMLICAGVLILTYLVGIVFTLHTHEKAIYSRKKNDRPQRRRTPIEDHSRQISVSSLNSPRTGPTTAVRRLASNSTIPGAFLPGATPAASTTIKRGNTATAVDTDSKQGTIRSPLMSTSNLLAGRSSEKPSKSMDTESIGSFASTESEDDDIGHDHPQWSRTKSTIILLVCTVCFAGIGEILIGSVDIVLDFVPPKFVGLTLFAIVPSITELYNGVAFALTDRIQMSMEIGNAYTAQVALLQIPVVVAFSAFWEWYNPGETSQGFTLVFPTLDCFAMVISLFLLSWVYSEGTANYFKGSMLLLTYIVVLAVFYFIPRTASTDEIF
ncbi:hypothetical protein HDU93_001499 [Gonapodya sp. JEL0774]|nr:hypothetical protein HDU93_001499 [Gonapodya sp. JEL0774]